MLNVALTIPTPDEDSKVGDKPTEEKPPCTSDEGVGCFYQINDHSRSGAINTKKQGKPYRTYAVLKCSRGHKFDAIYTLAENQTSKECEDAIDLTALS